MESAVIEHATYDDIRNIDVPITFDWPPPEEQFESEQWLHDNARVIRKAERPIAVFGVKTIWDGVGHCFGFVTKDASKFKKSLIVGLYRCMEIIQENERGFWRIQATVEAHANPAIRFLMHAGFNIDGLMPMYGPDKTDHLMMSRLL